MCGVGNLNNINVDDIKYLMGINNGAQHHPQQKDKDTQVQEPDFNVVLEQNPLEGNASLNYEE